MSSIRSLIFYKCCGSDAGGGDQESGEGVAGAGHLRHQAVVPGRLQRHGVSDLQVQHRRAGGHQETLGRVAQRHVILTVLHHFHTHSALC